MPTDKKRKKEEEENSTPRIFLRVLKRTEKALVLTLQLVLESGCNGCLHLVGPALP